MIEETMLTYIEETPSKMKWMIENRIALTKDLVNEYKKKHVSSIWMIACGSSSNAAECAKPFMMKYLNIDIKIVTPANFVYCENKVKDSDMVFVISQSGCSTNAIEALDYLHSMHRKGIALTGNVQASIKDHANLVIDYGVGEEKFGYVTKGVTTLCLFLMLFALEASNLEKEDVIQEMVMCCNYHEIMQQKAWKYLEDNYMELTSMHVVFMCGFAQGYGLAREAALKMSETVKIPCFAYEAEEYIHGPNIQLNPSYAVFLFDDLSNGSSRIKKIYEATKMNTPKTFFITDHYESKDPRVLNTEIKVKESTLIPLFILPVIQILAHQITTDLHRWDRHPLAQ
ncbi:MAG: SIS domain-containing protein, partial [Holdemanella sp.]|nr:SIS domain-containing protein [Holdemanella sp.]